MDAARAEDLSRAQAFIREQTRLLPVPLVPELSLYMADEPCGLWATTEEELGRTGLAPPFWAFAWAGGQALARHVLDHPETVRGARVLDLATGSGLVAIAAIRAGAASVAAYDIDPYAIAAVALNAVVNGVDLDAVLRDPLDGDGGDAEVVLAGDVFYDVDMAAAVLPFLTRAAERGATVLVGDPGRSYLPRQLLTERAVHDVPGTAGLEERAITRTTVWELRTAP